MSTWSPNFRHWTVVDWRAEAVPPALWAMLQPTGLGIVELGAITNAGHDTGQGNLALALGHRGPEQVGSVWSLSDGVGVCYASLVGHAYGEGGDGFNAATRPHIGLVVVEGSPVSHALGIAEGEPAGRLWISRGRWGPENNLPARSVRRGRIARAAPIAGGAGSKDPPDHSPKVAHTGATASWGGTYQATAAQSLSALAASRPPWW